MSNVDWPWSHTLTVHGRGCTHSDIPGGCCLVAVTLRLIFSEGEESLQVSRSTQWTLCCCILSPVWVEQLNYVLFLQLWRAHLYYSLQQDEKHLFPTLGWCYFMCSGDWLICNTFWICFVQLQHEIRHEYVCKIPVLKSFSKQSRPVKKNLAWNRCSFHMVSWCWQCKYESRFSSKWGSVPLSQACQEQDMVLHWLPYLL